MKKFFETLKEEFKFSLCDLFFYLPLLGCMVLLLYFKASEWFIYFSGVLLGIVFCFSARIDALKDKLSLDTEDTAE